jgi:plasmid stability protein
MRTTLTIDDAILRRLKDRAAREGRSFKDLVNQALRIGLAQKETPRPTKSFRLKPHRLGMKPGFHKISMNQLYDQVESESALQARQS